MRSCTIVLVRSEYGEANELYTGFKPNLVELAVKNGNRSSGQDGDSLNKCNQNIVESYDSDGISSVIDYFALPEATASLQSGVQVYL